MRNIMVPDPYYNTTADTSHWTTTAVSGTSTSGTYMVYVTTGSVHYTDYSADIWLPAEVPKNARWFDPFRTDKPLTVPCSHVEHSMWRPSTLCSLGQRKHRKRKRFLDSLRS